MRNRFRLPIVMNTFTRHHIEKTYQQSWYIYLRSTLDIDHQNLVVRGYIIITVDIIRYQKDAVGNNLHGPRH